LAVEERGASQERVLWIPGGRHPEVDSGVERHTLVTGNIIHIFHHTSTKFINFAAVREHISR
jgi:hypothetical protein